MMKLFVFIQHENDQINSVSLEALKGAQEIADKSDGTVTAVTFSSIAGDELTKYDLSEILVIEDQNYCFCTPFWEGEIMIGVLGV